MKFALPKAVSRITKKPTGDHAVHYRAQSMFTDATHWIAVLTAAAAILGGDEFRALLGPNALKYAIAAYAFVNIILRQLTVRPVAMVAPGKTKTVAVHKI